LTIIVVVLIYQSTKASVWRGCYPLMTSDTALCSSLKVGAEPEVLYTSLWMQVLNIKFRKGMR